MILKHYVKLNAMVTVNVIFCDKFEQVPAQFLYIIDAIVRQISSQTLYILWYKYHLCFRLHSNTSSEQVFIIDINRSHFIF